jgi:hypothetical protein
MFVSSGVEHVSDAPVGAGPLAAHLLGAASPRHARGSAPPRCQYREFGNWTPAFAGVKEEGLSGVTYWVRTTGQTLPGIQAFYVTTPQLPQSRSTVAGVGGCEWVRDFDEGIGKCLIST